MERQISKRMDAWLDGQKKGGVTFKCIFRRIHRRQEDAT